MKLFSQTSRGFYSFIGMLVLAVMIAACGNGGNTSPNSGSGSAAPVNGKGCTKIGILLPESASSDRWESKDHPLLVQDITAAIPGVHIDYNNAQGDSSVQLTQAEADLTNGDCILVVGAHDSSAAAAIVDKAKAKNVPVIAYDRLIQSKDLNYYVSFDNVKVGALQGQYIADNYQKFVSPGHNNMVMIDGSQTDNNALLFSKGAHSVLDPLISNKTLINTYETFTPDWNNATAQTEMEAALTKDQGNVQIAYVANDGMANNVIAALKAKKLNGHVLVTGQDATVAGIHNILVGDQSMTVYKPIAKEAQAVADLVKALYNGSDTGSLTNGATTATSDGGNIPSVLETPIAVDASNIATTVIADNYVSKADVCQGVPAGTDGVC
jgi:D-xylose transport system substrate-binding protein